MSNAFKESFRMHSVSWIWVVPHVVINAFKAFRYLGFMEEVNISVSFSINPVCAGEPADDQHRTF
jgi:hypothetical protein